MRYTPHLIDASEHYLPLAVGHIVRCPAFASGLRWKASPDDPLTVAWRDESYVDHHIRTGKAAPAKDPSRALASFPSFGTALPKLLEAAE
jgi:hypothetical protein